MPVGLLQRGQSKAFLGIASAIIVRRYPVLRRPSRPRSGLPDCGASLMGCVFMQSSDQERQPWRFQPSAVTAKAELKPRSCR
jgi:hypothetical protein